MSLFESSEYINEPSSVRRQCSITFGVKFLNIVEIVDKNTFTIMSSQLACILHFLIHSNIYLAILVHPEFPKVDT